MTNKFQMFDYGKKGNIEKYGQPVPPEYDLNKFKSLTFPMYIFGSERDAVVRAKDVRELHKYLPDTTPLTILPDYNHLDYIWAEDANQLIYSRVMNFLIQKGL